jgi:ATP/maltotriose-dependent transcriptional regulator MalT
MSVAWISLDPSDNDPLRFFQYLSAALETLQPDLAQELHPYLQTSGKLDIEAILIRLVNTLLCGPVIDQAALHGILNRIRDMNLKLLCLTIKEDQ